MLSVTAEDVDPSLVDAIASEVVLRMERMMTRLGARLESCGQGPTVDAAYSFDVADGSFFQEEEAEPSTSMQREGLLATWGGSIGKSTTLPLPRVVPRHRSNSPRQPRQRAETSPNTPLTSEVEMQDMTTAASVLPTPSEFHAERTGKSIAGHAFRDVRTARDLVMATTERERLLRSCSAASASAPLEEKPWLLRQVQSAWFAGMSFVVIFANTIVMVLHTDWEARAVVHFDYFQMWEYAFTALYSIELCLRLCALRRAFWCGDEKFWNIFDFTLVLTAVVEYTLTQRNGAGTFRGLRVLKVVRTLRIFRSVKFFRDLRMMLEVIINGVVALFWSTVLLAFLLLGFALAFVQMLTAYRRDIQGSDEFDKGIDTTIEKLFGSVPSGMVTLFMCTTGGVDWGEVYDITLLPKGVVGMLFMFYITFFQLAIFNIITSIFVDKARYVAAPDEDDAVAEKLLHDEVDRRRLRALVTKLDVDQSDDITFAELEEGLAGKDMMEYFHIQGLKVQDIKLFFRTLCSISHNKRLRVEDFVNGCMNVRGHASSLDMQALRLQVYANMELLDFIATQLNIDSRPTHSTFVDARGL